MPAEELRTISGVIRRARIEDPRLTVAQDRKRKDVLVANVDRRVNAEALISPPVRVLPPAPLFIANLASLATLAALQHALSATALLWAAGVVVLLAFFSAAQIAHNDDVQETIRKRLEALHQIA